MSPDTSFIPPNSMPPYPPIIKLAALIFSAFMALAFILMIGIICIDFIAEIMGHQLYPDRVLQHQEHSLSPIEPFEETRSPVELISPRHHTRIRNSEVIVIYTVRSADDPSKPPPLMINGVLHPDPWEMQYGKNTWFTRIALEPGEHCIRVAEEEAEFSLEPLGSERWTFEQWSWSYPHPDTDKPDRCSDCHVMFGSPAGLLTERKDLSIGKWKGAQSCFACHNEEDHKSVHSTLQPTSNRCLRCHTMH